MLRESSGKALPYKLHHFFSQLTQAPSSKAYLLKVHPGPARDQRNKHCAPRQARGGVEEEELAARGCGGRHAPEHVARAPECGGEQQCNLHRVRSAPLMYRGSEEQAPRSKLHSAHTAQSCVVYLGSCLACHCMHDSLFCIAHRVKCFAP